MLARLFAMLRRCGIDRAVGLTVLARGWTALAGVLSLVLITKRLSPAEQGYYFTFTNLLAFVVFVEMGLQTVVMQFASHERAQLMLTDAGTLAGDETAKSRLALLFRLTLRWYAVAGLIVLVTILPAGWLFLSTQHSAHIHWQIPWVWIVAVTAGSVVLTPVLSLLEGCGFIAELAAVQTAQNVLGSMLLWLALLLGWRLFAAPMTNTVYFLYPVIWIGLRKRRLLGDLLRTKGDVGAVDWRSEIWPLQWRMAISYISGFLAFQLFNPILFYYRGPAIAGQMGLSAAVMTSIITISIAWVGTRAARFGSLVAERRFPELDRLFFRSLWQSFALVTGLIFLVCVFDLIVHRAGYPIASRFLAPEAMAFLGIASIGNHIVYSEAIYLRAHKREPLVWLSLSVAALVATTSLIFGKYYSATAMMAAYAVVSISVQVLGATWIFTRSRREWHLPQAAPDIAAPVAAGIDG